jgi:hypothetical protein
MVDWVQKLHTKNVVLSTLLLVALAASWLFANPFFETLTAGVESRRVYEMSQLQGGAEALVNSKLTDVEFLCTKLGFDAGKPDSEECIAAREDWKEARSNYKNVMSKKAETLSPSRWVRLYYTELPNAASNRPLPFYGFIGCVAGVMVIVGLLFKSLFFEGKKGRGRLVQ